MGIRIFGVQRNRHGVDEVTLERVLKGPIQDVWLDGDALVKSLLPE